MNYPLISEYIEAIKAAEENFEQLKYLRPVLDFAGEPVMSSGNFAVVFKMKDEQTGKLYAVKCFLREQEGRAEAYRMIAEELEYVSSPFLTQIKYLDKELYVDTNASDETEFPVLLMDWVEGQTLDKYIHEHIDDRYELSLLAYQFSRLAMWLMPQPFAHGDLKPDNILVKNDGTLVLVDYDGMYVPAMKGQKARELGSPDFRHPNRTEADFDEHIDDFSLASILLSLKAIALQPDLLEEYGSSDRLLFSEKDYRNLSESKVMDALKSLMQDSEFAKLHLLYILAVTRKDTSMASIYHFKISEIGKPKTEKSAINGEMVESLSRRSFLFINGKGYYEILDVEKKAIDGLRIIQYKYGYGRICGDVCGDIRYALINEKNKLVSSYRFTSLARLTNGNIIATYPDPCNSNWKEERFTCILNTKGQPLFEYNVTTKDGIKQPRYCVLNNADAVSSCYYGIVLFVQNNRIGVVDYKGNVLIKPIYDDIILDRKNNYIETILSSKDHYESFEASSSDTTTYSITYLYHKSDYWPLRLHKLNSKYDVAFKDKDLYYLKNKMNSLMCMCYWNGFDYIIISPEYKSLKLLRYWPLDGMPTDALHIATNNEGKYGIISMPIGFEEVDPFTGNPIYNEIQTVCPFDYDYIAEDYSHNVILVKNRKEGLFSCSLKIILVDCVIPTIGEYTYSIIPSTFGEGVVGCRERTGNKRFSSTFSYSFYDVNGNKVLDLPKGWRIKSGFKNGIAQIQTGDYIIKIANIDKAGNVTIVKEGRGRVIDESDDIESLYRDAFENDPSMEWNID